MTDEDSTASADVRLTLGIKDGLQRLNGRIFRQKYHTMPKKGSYYKLCKETK